MPAVLGSSGNITGLQMIQDGVGIPEYAEEDTKCSVCYDGYSFEKDSFPITVVHSDSELEVFKKVNQFYFDLADEKPQAKACIVDGKVDKTKFYAQYPDAPEGMVKDGMFHCLETSHTLHQACLNIWNRTKHTCPPCGREIDGSVDLQGKRIKLIQSGASIEVKSDYFTETTKCFPLKKIKVSDFIQALIKMGITDPLVQRREVFARHMFYPHHLMDDMDFGLAMHSRKDAFLQVISSKSLDTYKVVKFAVAVGVLITISALFFSTVDFSWEVLGNQDLLIEQCAYTLGYGIIAGFLSYYVLNAWYINGFDLENSSS